jgi:predicted ATPase
MLVRRRRSNPAISLRRPDSPRNDRFPLMSWKRHDTVASAYAARVASGEFSADPAQVALAERLDTLLSEVSTKRLATKSSALGWMFGRKRSSNVPPRGLYVHGSVGRGKTMLMDMFFELVPAKRKRRAHFSISWPTPTRASMPTGRNSRTARPRKPIRCRRWQAS